MTGKWGQIQGSLQSMRNFDGRVLSIPLILMEAEGWGEKEICSEGLLTVKNKERGGGGGVKITPPANPLSTLTPNQIWPVR